MTETPAPPPKPKRPARKKKAPRKPRASQPLPFKFWLMLTGIFLFLAVLMVLDPFQIVNYRSTSTSGSVAFFELIFAIMYALLGNIGSGLLLGGLAVLCVVWGIYTTYIRKPRPPQTAETPAPQEEPEQNS